MKHHSFGELEAIAAGFLSKHGKGKYDGVSLLIEAIIEGSGFYIWAVPGLKEKAEAYVPVRGNKIYVDEDQYRSATSFRSRFTLAEELAHILIHRPLFAGMDTPEIIKFQKAIPDADYLRMERNAKYLAGALLMKKDVFEKRFNHFWQKQQSRTPVPVFVFRYVVRRLSSDFFVSCHAAAIRSRHLGLVTQAQLNELLEISGW
jgi:Zn-dependent peptidase ImmA (M78 family)